MSTFLRSGNVLREAHGWHISQLCAAPKNYCPLLKQEKRSSSQRKPLDLAQPEGEHVLSSVCTAEREFSQQGAGLGTTMVQARLRTPLPATSCSEKHEPNSESRNKTALQIRPTHLTPLLKLWGSLTWLLPGSAITRMHKKDFWFDHIITWY